MSVQESLPDFLDAARVAAERGAAVLEQWRQRFHIREKARADLVTEADVASQQTIRDYLLGRFPGHGFLGEEEGRGDARPAPAATSAMPARSSAAHGCSPIPVVTRRRCSSAFCR